MYRVLFNQADDGVCLRAFVAPNGAQQYFRAGRRLVHIDGFARHGQQVFSIYIHSGAPTRRCAPEAPVRITSDRGLPMKHTAIRQA
jgi:hypothetical protein